MTKKELRKSIRELKSHYSPEQLVEISKGITTAIGNYIIKKDGLNTILLYHSMPDEVHTHTLINTLVSNGITVLLPTIVGNELELHQYISPNCCHTESTYSIVESNGPLFTEYHNIDLAIIPGIAFTKKGHRLGRGKGFYDRLLPKLNCPLLGLAFPFQIVDSIPSDEHDVMMNYVIS